MATYSRQFTKLATPATLHTREIGFVVKVDGNEEWIGTSRMPVQGTTYTDAPFSHKPELTTYGAYICTRIENTGDTWYFYFSKNKTTAEALTPFDDPEPSFGNHFWPPILLTVGITTSQMRAVNLGDKIRRGFINTAVPIWIPSADTGSQFRVRQYLSPTMFEIPPHPTPITRSVSFPVPGGQPFSFPENLGPDITVPAMRDSDSEYDVALATVTSQVGFVGERFFKATDPKTWLPYIMSARQSKIATGAYLMTEIEVIPPNLPKAQRGFR